MSFIQNQNKLPFFYIHGYLSSPEGTKGVVFNDKLNVISLKYRDVKPEQLIIKDCVTEILNTISAYNEVGLIGSSLGGLLAAITALKTNKVTKLILLNPAIMPPDTNIYLIDSMPHRILREMVIPELFSQKLLANIIIFRGTEDDVVPDSWVLEFGKYQEATVHFLSDDHRFSKKLDIIVEMVKKYL